MNLSKFIPLIWLPLVAHGAAFYCDPQEGRGRGDGSVQHPWGKLEEVLASGKIQLRSAEGKLLNPTGPVKAGDTIFLLSGWHGALRIAAGYNEEPIVLAAAPDATPQFSSVEIGEGKNWIVRGVIISPSLAPQPIVKPPRELVMLGERGGESSTNLVVENCFIYSVLDTSAWSGRDWVDKPSSGIWLGRHGRRHIARNNYVLNTRFGIQLCAPECIAEGNVVANFSADGLRVTRDGQVAQYNVIKNNFVGARDGDDNHDDGIQVFLFNAGTGPVRDVTVRGNIILAREKDGLPFPNGLQGIGCFDGPLIRFLVESNVVCVNHFHGVSLYDAQDCVIQNNTCFSRWSDRAQPWVMLGQKKNLAAANTVQHNFAHSFQFKADSQVKADDNQPVTAEIFQKRLAALASFINEKFGETIPAANRPRLETTRAPANRASAPYPPSSLKISWHWETLTNAAPGSDLWPVTWGPDDQLYAAWGDGGGFGGSNSDGRVAMGFARIEGSPENWRGININGGKNPENPATFLEKGKTSGIAFVDGVLYTTINLQDGKWPDVNHVLAWSTDKGTTWEHADWLFPRGEGNFQPSKFLAAGKDYKGLPKEFAGYVYVYGPRRSSSPGNGNKIYLARAPRERLREEGAWQFFRRSGESSEISWAQGIGEATPVFEDPNGVTPPAVVYNPALKGFLASCFHPGGSQLGVFEGPTPWGPWKTISYEEGWGRMQPDCEGLTCAFPDKWISSDGLTLWCIFSVYGEGAKKGINAHDRFNLVRAALQR